jgi:hypothetical protein
MQLLASLAVLVFWFAVSFWAASKFLSVAGSTNGNDLS